MPGDAAASRGGRSAYEVLGVPRGASAAELRRAFEQLAKAAHPDTSARGAASAARFQEVKEAYDLLRHAERRRAYDARSGARHQHGRYGAYDAAADRAMQERAEEFRKRYQRGFHAPDDDGLAGASAARRFSFRMMEVLFRPKTLLLLPPILALASWLATRRLSGGGGGKGGLAADESAEVAAWFNPATRRWESPAPWDAAYSKQRATLRMLPREQVHASRLERATAAEAAAAAAAAAAAPEAGAGGGEAAASAAPSVAQRREELPIDAAAAPLPPSPVDIR